MFSRTMRRRPSFASAIPNLQSSTGLALREATLDTHDIMLPLNAIVKPEAGNAFPTRQLRVLLVSASSISETRLNETITRIRHFALLTGGQDLDRAIIFLLAPPRDGSFLSAKVLTTVNERAASDNEEGWRAYALLQATLADHAEIPYIPLLPLATLERLAELLQMHSTNLTRPPLARTSAIKQQAPIDLLCLCTANPPMPPQTASVLSNIFPDLSSLASACLCITSTSSVRSLSELTAAEFRASQIEREAGTMDKARGSVISGGDEPKLRRLRNLVGERQFGDIINFWRGGMGY